MRLSRRKAPVLFPATEHTEDHGPPDEPLPPEPPAPGWLARLRSVVRAIRRRGPAS